jgi:Xaa-Pro aminopeptidase
LRAAKVLDETAAKTWNWIGQELNAGRKLSEYEVQQFILNEIHKNGCIMDSEPIVGVNGNSANPHYAPSKEKSQPIKKGDFILIDLWCRQKEEDSVYADITRVAVAAEKPSARQQQVFEIVRRAQKAATDFVRDKFAKNDAVKGFEVDQISRSVIEEAGFGEFFTHRTGHNIDKETHGPGANIDSLETLDERRLIRRSCFSIEPGIYLPGEFGVRLEYDVYIHETGQIQVTGGVQEAIVCID